MKTKCPNCHSCFNVPLDSKGRKTKCPKCENLFVIQQIPKSIPKPAKSAANVNLQVEKDFPFQDDVHTPSILPLWVWGLFGVFAVIILCIVLWAFVLRDTWEQDHLNEIQQLASQANTAVYSGDAKTGLEVYDRLFNLVGNRTLKGKAKDILTEAQTAYPQAEEKYENGMVESLSPLLAENQKLFDEARKTYSGLSIQETTARLNIIHANFDQMLNTATARRPKGKALENFVQRIQNTQQLIENTLLEINKKIRLAEKQQQEEARQQAQQQTAEQREDGEITSTFLKYAKAAVTLDAIEKTYKAESQLYDRILANARITGNTNDPNIKIQLNKVTELISQRTDAAKEVKSQLEKILAFDQVKVTEVGRRLFRDENIQMEYRIKIATLFRIN